MFKRVIHTGWFAATPLLLTAILALVFFSFQRVLVDCREDPCGQVTIAGLFEPDLSVAVNPAGAIVVPPVVIPDTAGPATTQALRKAGEAARLRMLTAAAERHSARLVVLFFVGLGLIASAAAFGVAALMLSPPQGEARRRYTILRGVVLAFAGAMCVMLYLHPGHGGLSRQILHRTVAGQAALAEPRAVHLLTLVTALQLAASFALVVACVSLLLPVQRSETAESAPAAAHDPEERLRSELRPLTHRLMALRIFLFVATVLLVIGVLRMQAVWRWALSFVGPEAAQALASVASTVPSLTGAFYTLVLVAVYVPSAFALRTRVNTVIADAALPAEKADAMRAAVLPGDSIMGAIPRIAALTAPLLAGPIAKLLEQL